jgi:hypothetical protein
MKIQITPVQIFPNTATQIEFLPAEVTLGVSARSQYILQTAEGKNLTSAWISMTPEQYALWANNDDYAAKCFLENLGITPLTPIEVQLSTAVSDQRGDIATYEAEKATANEAKAAAEAAEQAAKAAADAAEKENARLAQALAVAEAAAKAAADKQAFDDAVAAAVREAA